MSNKPQSSSGAGLVEAGLDLDDESLDVGDLAGTSGICPQSVNQVPQEAVPNMPVEPSADKK